MVWILASLLFLALAFLIAQPLLGGTTFHPTMERSLRGGRRRDLREEKARAFLALRELDFDYETGKLDASDYKEIRAKYEAKAVEVLKELESIEKDWQSVQDRVDQELAKRIGAPFRSASPTSPRETACPSCGAAAKNDDRFCGSCGGELAKPSCRQCGQTLRADQRFCPGCGTAQEGRARYA